MITPDLLALISACNQRLQGMLAERIREEARKQSIEAQLVAAANATRARSADYRRADTSYAKTFGSEVPKVDKRPTPKLTAEERLSPWDRAWGRLTDDERAWSSK